MCASGFIFVLEGGGAGALRILLKRSEPPPLKSLGLFLRLAGLILQKFSNAYLNLLRYVH